MCCLQMLDPACGILVISSISISISNGVTTSKPAITTWASGMVAIAAGNNKIVRTSHATATNWHSVCVLCSATAILRAFMHHLPCNIFVCRQCNLSLNVRCLVRQAVRNSNAKLDVKTSLFDLGGTPSKIIKGLSRFNALDNNGNTVAVNVRPCLAVHPSTCPCCQCLL